MGVKKKEMKKNNLVADLEEANYEKYDSPEILGKGMMGFVQYNNAMRSIMFSSHLNQYKTPINAEYPRVFTNMENLVGKNSDGYQSAPENLEVYAKVEKYADIVDHPQVYALFVFRQESETYDVVLRSPAENLMEMFGYEYENGVIDNYEVGDEIPKDQVLFHSSSYDETMNYGYGLNVTTMTSLHSDTSEDAAIISESLAKKFLTLDTDTITIGINDNDFPLNIYGDDVEYKSFPDIGEKSNGVVMATRRQYNDQIMYDFRSDVLTHYIEGDTEYFSEGEVYDVDVFCNNPDIEENTFNRQILRYLDSQTEYWTEIKQVCEEIRNSGFKYTSDVDYLYKRSLDFIDRDKKWKDKDNDNGFSNLQVYIYLKRNVGLTKGSKITGRHGNKSVIAKVRPDDMMPYTEDGRRIDLIINLLQFINRTIGGPLFEMSISFLCTKAVEHMKTLSTIEKQEEFLFEFIGMLNQKESDRIHEIYKALSKTEKKAFMADTFEHGIYIHMPPIGEDRPIFYKIRDVYEKYDWLEPQQVYINKWGRKRIPIIQKQYIGEMYLMALKQTSKKGFSVRGMGAINNKGLPERSYKNKSHMELYSTSNIRFGESENLNFPVVMSPEEVALFNAYYRSSVDARKDLGKAVLQPNKVVKMDKKYISRVGEILAVLLKSLGVKMDIVSEENILDEVDDTYLKEYTPEDMTYLCTDYQAFLYDRLVEIQDKIMEENPIMDTQELIEEADYQMAHSGYVTGTEDYEDRISVFAENMELANHIVKLHEPKEDSDKEESKE